MLRNAISGYKQNLEGLSIDHNPQRVWWRFIIFETKVRQKLQVVKPPKRRKFGILPENGSNAAWKKHNVLCFPSWRSTKYWTPYVVNYSRNRRVGPESPNLLIRDTAQCQVLDAITPATGDRSLTLQLILIIYANIWKMNNCVEKIS